MIKKNLFNNVLLLSLVKYSKKYYLISYQELRNVIVKRIKIFLTIKITLYFDKNCIWNFSQMLCILK